MSTLSGRMDTEGIADWDRPASSICNLLVRKKRRNLDHTCGSANTSRICSIKNPPCDFIKLPARIREKSVINTSSSVSKSMPPNISRSEQFSSTITGAPFKSWLSTTIFTLRQEKNSTKALSLTSSSSHGSNTSRLFNVWRCTWSKYARNFIVSLICLRKPFRMTCNSRSSIGLI